MPKQGKLIDLLLEASKAEGVRRDDWIFLNTENPNSTSPALLIQDEYDTVDGLERIAAEAGFPREGLQASDVQEIFLCVSRLTRSPTDEQIIRAFDYYLRFDAFLPSIDAPDPKPDGDALPAWEREFFHSLGAEDETRPCKHEDCKRGSTHLSLFCAPHHFENVRGKPWPY